MSRDLDIIQEIGKELGKKLERETDIEEDTVYEGAYEQEADGSIIKLALDNIGLKKILKAVFEVRSLGFS